MYVNMYSPELGEKTNYHTANAQTKQLRQNRTNERARGGV